MRLLNCHNFASWLENQMKMQKNGWADLECLSQNVITKKLIENLKKTNKQFIHGLNDSNMSTEIIRELTKIEDNGSITNE